MHLPRIPKSIRARTVARTKFASPVWISALGHVAPPPAPSTVSPSLIFHRPSTHQTQRSVNTAKDGPGKRLGAKKSGEQYVIPGNIIFRQRGTLWFPGTNAGLGRDHTIYATESGYVKYYRDPARHPKRKYIGVAFERHHSLPYPPNAPRQRRLGMVAVPRQEPPATVSPDEPSEQLTSYDPARRSNPVVRLKSTVKGRPIETVLSLRPGYMYRESNWEIGRVVERAGIKVPKYKMNDRFRAWRKRAAGKKRRAERRAMFSRDQKARKPAKKRGGR